MDLSQLRGAKYNPRIITDKALELLGDSIEEFGDLSGVVFNRRTKTLVSGHQRIKILKTKKTKIVTKPSVDDKGTVEVGHIETVGRNKKDNVKIPFRVVDWDRRTEKAANIAANAHGGKFDSEKLAVLVAELDTEEFAIESIGLDDLTLKQLRKMDSSEKEKLEQFEEIDEDSFDLQHTCPKCSFRFND